MKKLIIAAVAAGMMSTAAFAEVGTIIRVIVKSNNTAKVVLDPSDATKANQACNLNTTTDAGKAMLATAMTGKTSGSEVNIYRDGSNNCTNISLQ